MKYQPNPIDISAVKLPEGILDLIETLAKSTHDGWAQRRISEGWTYGPKRDDILKQHPCLVPYENLPDSEKEYDRSTTLRTLKAIIALGFRIEPARDRLPIL